MQILKKLDLNLPVITQEDELPTIPPARRRSQRISVAAAMRANLNTPLHIPIANAVIHPVTKETITKYAKLIKDPLLARIWKPQMCKELGRLSQGYDDVEGTNTIVYMTPDMVKNIPRDRTVTYARIVIDVRPQKEDPNRVRITAGGNLIFYPEELTTRTADLITTKIMWNSVQLHDKVINGHVYMEIRRGMYGLPQAGILANKLLRKRLQPRL